MAKNTYYFELKTPDSLIDVECRLMHEKRVIPFRKENFDIDFHYWLCEDTHEHFEDEEQAESNINQVYHQYGLKHGISVSQDISQILEMA